MSDEAPKLRLRPKLAADAPPASPQPPAAPPTSAQEGAAPPAAVRLRPRVPTAAPAIEPAASAPAAAASVATADAPPPLSVAAGPAPAAVVELTDAKARSTRKVQRAALVIGVAGVLVFSGVAFLAYQKVRAMTARFAADEVAERAANQERPPTADKNDATAVADSASRPAPSKSEPPTTTPPPAATPSPAAIAKPAPAVAAAPAEPPAAVTNAAAQTWITKAKISGVRTGSSPKVLLGGKTFNVGDVVHPELGIVFAGYDAQRDLVAFKDAQGTLYERRPR